MSLSRDKQHFMSLAFSTAYQLSVEDLRPLIRHYFIKFNITIILNGDTLWGQKTRAEYAWDGGLTKADICAEILAIQKTLQADEQVGYLFASGFTRGLHHIEPFIITQDKVIKPVWWELFATKTLSHEDLQDMYVPHWREQQPQASGAECGTLSLLYLKELLKDKGKQLREYSLLFPCYTQPLWAQTKQRPPLSHFYFPSPQVLRYSQVTGYVTTLAKMIQTDLRDQVTDPDPLAATLRDSIAFAKEYKDDATLTNNTQLLAELPAFRKKWSEAYEIAKQKRDAMKCDGWYRHNEYLVYRSISMMNKLAAAPKNIDYLPFSKLFSATDEAIEPVKKAMINLLAQADFQSQPLAMQDQLMAGLVLRVLPDKPKPVACACLPFFKAPASAELDLRTFLTDKVLATWLSLQKVTREDCSDAYEKYQLEAKEAKEPSLNRAHR